MQRGPATETVQTYTLSISGMEGVPLRPGESVTAEVLHCGADQIATIRLKNATLEAQSEVPLRKGDTILLRIERRENAVYIRIAGEVTGTADAAGRPLHAALTDFGKLGSGTEAMTRLVELLKLMPKHIQENLPEIDIVNRFLLRIDQLNGKTLQDAVMNGGVFFESKLRILALGMEADAAASDIEAGRIIAGDLKASLLRLKETFLSPVVMQCLKDTIPPDDLIGALNSVLRTIEFCQIKSKLTDALWYVLPLVWEGLREGEVMLWETDQGSGVRAYSCAITLDLEQAGKIQAGMLFQAGYVHVNYAAENERLVGALQKSADLLEQRFSRSGLRLGNLTVVHQAGIVGRGASPTGLRIHA